MNLNTAWLGEKQRVTTRITPQLKTWLTAEARSRKVSVSELVRALVIQERRRVAGVTS